MCGTTVTIDYENREQVERLLDSLRSMSFAAHACGAFTCLQAALREFAKPTPPLPEEPCDWSVAIVADSVPFTRTARAHITKPYDHCWFGEHPRSGERVRLTWADLHDLGTVKVVGRGVPS